MIQQDEKVGLSGLYIRGGPINVISDYNIITNSPLLKNSKYFFILKLFFS